MKFPLFLFLFVPLLRSVFGEIKLFDVLLRDDETFFLRNQTLSYDIEYKIRVRISGINESNVPLITSFSSLGTFDVAVRYSTGKPIVWRSFPGSHVSRFVCLKTNGKNLNRLLVSGSLISGDQKSTDSESFIVVVSTFNTHPLKFEIKMELRDISVSVGQSRNDILTPGSPIVWKFIPSISSSTDFLSLPKKMLREQSRERRFTVVVRSKQRDTCGLIAVQDLTCPFHDLESNAAYLTKWQAFLGTSAMDFSFHEKDDDRKGLYIVAIAKSNSSLCSSSSIVEGVKDVTVDVYEQNYSPELVSILVLCLYVLVCCTGIFLSICCSFPIEGRIANLTTIEEETTIQATVCPLAQCDETDVVFSRDVLMVNTATSMSDMRLPNVKEVLIFDVDKIKQIRCKKDLTVGDLALKCDYDKFPDTLHMKSSLYVWIIFLMGIFYTLPVFQLVKNYERLSKQTGDDNICYYNYMCKVKWASLEDYGHVFSNVGYVVLGLCFIAMTCIRRIRECENNLRYNKYKRSIRVQKGIPEQYGVFFAMGGALCMEGILSGCYHICPTAENFQFDTTFMYVLAVLVFLKVYQFRHPDITANAYIVFSVIGGALVFEVLGVYLSNAIFWILFILSYMSVVVFFVVQTYYNGVLNPFLDGWRDALQEFYQNRRTPNLSPIRRGKFFGSAIIIAVNMILAIYFGYHRKPGVSRYLLLILMMNMSLYVAYYVSMKLYYRFSRQKRNESINNVCILYVLAMIVCILISVYFFSKELKNSSLSPAESRDMNEECFVFIFDNHDIWHFFSAAGLFFNFMMILTLEDDNLNTPWDQIPVF